ncbi:alpha/beta fold hydrolase [Streptomyces sp. NPDC087420]|uniref:alpha/beta fold hydrolase n=1 Tax=Streptomyces sp. NPDC087420 TaxID=3365785 RepID=UPI00383450EE
MGKNFVMIPGAWHAAWCWRPVAKRLRAAGNTTLALTMPGLGDDEETTGLHLQDAVDHIAAEFQRRDLTDVTLVAHSWGGYPMTGAAHRVADRLAKIVYCSAFVPLRGKSARAELAGEGAAAIRDEGIRVSTEGPAWLPPWEFARESLIQDEPEAVQRLVWELLTPQPANYGAEALDVPDVTTLGIPVAYVLSEHDLGLGTPEAGARFAARLGVRPIMVPGSHESLLTHPDEVAHALMEA